MINENIVNLHSDDDNKISFKALLNNNEFVVSNWIEWKHYKYIKNIIYSDNNWNISYIASNWIYQNGKYEEFIVKEWKELDKYFWNIYNLKY